MNKGINQITVPELPELWHDHRYAFGSKRPIGVVDAGPRFGTADRRIS